MSRCPPSMIPCVCVCVCVLWYLLCGASGLRRDDVHPVMVSITFLSMRPYQTRDVTIASQRHMVRSLGARSASGGARGGRDRHVSTRTPRAVATCCVARMRRSATPSPTLAPRRPRRIAATRHAPIADDWRTTDDNAHRRRGIPRHDSPPFTGAEHAASPRHPRGARVNMTRITLPPRTPPPHTTNHPVRRSATTPRTPRTRTHRTRQLARAPSGQPSPPPPVCGRANEGGGGARRRRLATSSPPLLALLARLTRLARRAHRPSLITKRRPRRGGNRRTPWPRRAPR